MFVGMVVSFAEPPPVLPNGFQRPPSSLLANRDERLKYTRSVHMFHRTVSSSSSSCVPFALTPLQKNAPDPAPRRWWVQILRAASRGESCDPTKAWIQILGQIVQIQSHWSGFGPGMVRERSGNSPLPPTSIRFQSAPHWRIQSLLLPRMTAFAGAFAGDVVHNIVDGC